MDVGQWIVVVLCIVLVIWYFMGITINRRRGLATYQWLRTGMEQLGEISEARWLGSSGSGALLVVGKANAPFRRIEVVFWLEAREILPMWLLNRLRNKRDVIILKAGLRNAPPNEIEVASSKNREFIHLVAEKKMSHKRLPIEGDFLIAYRRDKTSLLKHVEDYLNRYGGAIQRLSIQRKEPHLLMCITPLPLRNVAVDAFFKDLIRFVSIDG